MNGMYEELIEKLRKNNRMSGWTHIDRLMDDAIKAIEALQQEIEQLKDENTSLRNWNACEEELHNELLESDKRRWELESELEDANNYRAGLEAIVDKLRAQVARMREALRKAREAIKAAWSDGSVNAAMDKASEALTAIDKAIGGKEDEKTDKTNKR